MRTVPDESSDQFYRDSGFSAFRSHAQDFSGSVCLAIVERNDFAQTEMTARFRHRCPPPSDDYREGSSRRVHGEGIGYDDAMFFRRTPPPNHAS